MVIIHPDSADDLKAPGLNRDVPDVKLRGEAALGTSGSFVVTPDHAAVLDETVQKPKPEKKSKSSPAEQVKKKKKQYTLRGIARDTLIDIRRVSKNGKDKPEFGVCTCGLHIAPSPENDFNSAYSTVPVTYDKETGRSGFHHLEQCDSPWICPVCASRLAQQRAEEIDHIIDTMYELGKRPIMATLTMQHHINILLDDMKEGFQTAHQRMLQDRGMREELADLGVDGGIFCREILDNPINGWHLHAHDIFFVDKDTDNEALDFLRDEISKVWRHQLKLAGGFTASDERYFDKHGVEHGVGVDVTGDFFAIAEYVEKFGHGPKENRWSIGAEVAKAPLKQGRVVETGNVELHPDWVHGKHPFELLEEAETNLRSRERFREYAIATKKMHQYDVSPKIREMVKLAELKAKLEEERELKGIQDVIGEFDQRNWKRLVLLDKKGFQSDEPGRSIKRCRMIAEYCGIAFECKGDRTLINERLAEYDLYLGAPGEYERQAESVSREVTPLDRAVIEQANRWLEEWNGPPRKALDESLINLRW